MIDPRFSLTVLLFALLPLFNYGQRPKYVPKEYASIQKAIESCQGGEMIIVSAGEYKEMLNIGIPVSIMAEDYMKGDVAAYKKTIINAEGKGSVINIDGDSKMAVTLSGLTITGGTGTELEPWPGEMVYEFQGGGILLTRARLVMHHCMMLNDSADTGGGIGGMSGTLELDSVIFQGCHASKGGAVGFSGSAATISRCRFVGNTAKGEGGAVYCNARSKGLKVERCEFIENKAEKGGGLVHRSGNIHLSGCSFVGNSASEGAAIFIPIYEDSMRYRFHRTVFRKNLATKEGGAIDLADWGHGTTIGDISHCLFDSNQAANGEALFLTAGPVFLRNSIFVNHTKNALAANSYVKFGDGIRNNCFYNNGKDFAGSNDTLGAYNQKGENGMNEDLYSNFSSDPKLRLQSNGNWSLDPTSPCIDRGYATPPVGFDLPVPEKLEDGKGDDKATADIGPFEYKPPR